MEYNIKYPAQKNVVPTLLKHYLNWIYFLGDI